MGKVETTKEVVRPKKSKAVAPLESMMNLSIERIKGLIIQHQSNELKCASTKDKEYEHTIVCILTDCLQDINAMKEHCVSRNKF